MTRTKIICTIGPSTSCYEKILELLDAGMNVARINFSHGTHEEHAILISYLKKARLEKKVPLAIMVDTRGPEIRLGEIAGGSLVVKAHDKIYLANPSSLEHITLNPAEVFPYLEPGIKVLFDDGYIEGRVVEKKEHLVTVEILNSGILKSYKSVALPNLHLQLTEMTQQDIRDLSFACAQDVDWIAASFIRSADHIHAISNLLAVNGKYDISVMAKIESAEGVTNFDSILPMTQGIMVARGDLGVELPLEKVPSLQKFMIRKCRELSKPVVTATQMLESMIYNPRPTRAEVSDVANAIYDSSSAVMLSGETAVGKYPVEAVAMMRKVIRQTELDFDYRGFYDQNLSLDFTNVSSSIASAAVQTAYMTKARAIFVFTVTGATARLISRFRPEMPIFALTPSEKTYHQLSMEWGVIPSYAEANLTLEEAIAYTSRFALVTKQAREGDFVVITTGTPFWSEGTTNTLIVEKISSIL